MAETVEGRGVTLRQRRQLGVTIRNIARVTRTLMQDGTITRDTPKEDVSELVLEQLTFDNPKAFADPTLDWDALLAFIERLIPLIMAIIALF